MLGDALIFYAALFTMLVVRYGAPLAADFFNIHIWPFTALLPLWIIIFYVGGLYDLRLLKNNLAFLNRSFAALGAAALLAVLLFYFVRFFGIAPKINLFIFLASAAALGTAWRYTFNRLLSFRTPHNRLLFIGESPAIEWLIPHLRDNPQHDLEVVHRIRGGVDDPEFKELSVLIQSKHITTIVISASLKTQVRAARAIYKNLALGIEVIDLTELCENVFKKVPLAELREVWFLDNIATHHHIYEALKRPIEFTLILLLLPLFIPLTILVGICVFLLGGWPVLYTQKRVGQHERVFTLYKFRTMRRDAERAGPQWAKEGDRRTISGASFLRLTHFDELPQLWNILRGDLSIVGPRPERPEFTEELRKEIPFYNLRHLVRPGVTGWAQTNYRYGASTEDALRKLEFDIYYIKHRSVLLDILTVLRTIRLLFSNIK